MLSHIKRLIAWARTDAPMPAGIERPTVVREIETHFVLTGNGATNGAIARPRNKDTCRGDAPPTAIFDEAAFLQRAFWCAPHTSGTAVPSLIASQVRLCVPTLSGQGSYCDADHYAATSRCTPSTLCALGSHFSPGGFFESVVRLIKDANARGDRYFNLQNDSLVCTECLKNRIPERCCHMFGCLPSWKSLIQLRHSMVRLVSKQNQEAFKMEVRSMRWFSVSRTHLQWCRSWAQWRPTGHRTSPTTCSSPSSKHPASRRPGSRRSLWVLILQATTVPRWGSPQLECTRAPSLSWASQASRSLLPASARRLALTVSHADRARRRAGD
jgi:hypothetical protein